MDICAHERQARKLLTEAQVDSPGLCARLLTAHVAQLNKIEYVLAASKELSKTQACQLQELVQRRAKGEPLAYILGEKEFYGMNFLVNKHTLVPRPETELLVDLALKHFSARQSIVFADIGCGSGCIGLCLLHFRPRWQGVLLDNVPQALAVSRQNAKSLHLTPKIILGDLFHAPLAEASLDLLVSNPPYIGKEERHLVMQEVLAHEPHCALFSAANGTAHLNAALHLAARCLKPGGVALLEHGVGQHDFMARTAASLGFAKVEEAEDLAGIKRCTVVHNGGAYGGTQGF